MDTLTALILCGVLLTSLRANATITSNENPTHLKPLIATNNNNNINGSNNNISHSQADTSAEESINIENRQLYDTVKHASGYDPDVNNNSHDVSIKDIEELSNKNSSSATTAVRIHPRKSAVIQAIPRKVRGPGGNTHLSTTSSMTFVKPPSSLQPTVKDYGAGEPTTTIVYATSIPTSTPSRTFVNIRPVPLLSNQKYRSTVVVENERANHHHDVKNTKPVVEHQQYSVDEQQHQQQQRSNDDENHQEHKLLVLKKTDLRDDSNSMQSTTTPRTQAAVLPYQTDQQERNPYKSILYSRIRTNNEEINDELPSNNRQTFYPNHKWTNEDYLQRGLQLMPPPPLPLTPASAHFVYENPDPRRDYYHPPLSPHTHPPASSPHQNQNFFRPRYIAADSHQEEMYNPAYDSMPQQQAMHGLLSRQQERKQQDYQPLTVRDFDLLLQLLVLREQRLHNAHQDPYLSSSTKDFNCRNNQQENSYYYTSPKALALASSIHDSPSNFKIKYMDNSMLRSQQQQQQQSTTQLLPSNVREELLFRMLLLALHLQPQTQAQSQPKPVSRFSSMLPEHHYHPNMYLGTPTSSSSPEPSPYQGFRHLHRSATFKNPVRSVQVLGEID